MTLVAGAITVWVNPLGIQERFVWEGTRYRVTDAPTPLEFNIDAVTHIPVIPQGWRFQGTPDDGESLIFDVAFFDDHREWRVIHTYR